MLRRTYIGLEIRDDILNAVAIRRRASKLTLSDCRQQSLAVETLDVLFKEPNVKQPLVFIEALKNCLNPLVKGDKRIAVALPDRAGQLFLLELETPFKNRGEGAELIRWQLKDQLPEKASQKISLDYQVLEEKDSGQKRILAAVISMDVLAQYEALFEQAGFAAEVIDFHALALYNAYRGRVDLGRDFLLIGIDGDQLSVQCFANRVLVFCRQRCIEKDPQAVYQELNRSLAALPKETPALGRMQLHLHTDWADRETLLATLGTAFEQPVQMLTSPLASLEGSQRPDLKGTKSYGFATALGVAERSIVRVTS